MSKLGRLEQPGQPLAVASVDLALHQHGQSILEGHLGRRGTAGLIGQRVDHAVQPQSAQLVQGVFIEQEKVSFVR